MKGSFETFLFQELQVSPKSKLLLAVSGGMDSMCLWELCRASNLDFIVAHCNFQLRGEESDKDEKFVLEHGLKNEEIYSKSFDTKKYVCENSVSIQMAARALRYAWFRELKEEKKCDYIVTAHHLDDQIETFFIQLLRKSPLQGLSGMPVKTDEIIRPLMFVGRESIESFIEQHKIPYREDASNDSDLYLRNRIRRNLIPILQKTSPDFKKSILDTMGNMKEVSNSFELYVDKKKAELLRKIKDEVRIDIDELKKIEFPQIFLDIYLRELGFAKSISKNLLNALDGESGRTFFSRNMRIIKDRKDIIVLPLKLKEEDELTLLKEEIVELNDFFIKSALFANSKGVMEKAGKGIALLDYDNLNDKISFRKWRNGDYFYPLGLGGKKKLSDYFIDKKFSLADKERQWVLCSGNEICWIVGYSIDDRFRIREKTKVVLFLELQ